MTDLQDLSYLAPMSAEQAAKRMNNLQLVTEVDPDLVEQALSTIHELGWVQTGYNRFGQPVYRPPFENQGN